MKKFLKLKYLYMLLFVIGFCIGYNSVSAATISITDHPVIQNWNLEIPQDAKFTLYKDTSSTGKITYKLIYVDGSVTNFDKACYYNYNDLSNRVIYLYNNNVKLTNMPWYVKQYIYDTTTLETSSVGGETPVTALPFLPAYYNNAGGNITELIYSNFDIYLDNNFSTVQFTKNDIQEDSISDLNSRIKITYNYNEDFTNCNVKVNLENGAFTDSIYYSNLPPSISGQGLLSKKIFPRERFDFN